MPRTTTTRRRLNIAIRDQTQALVPGMLIEFEIDGAPAGRVESSDGRGDINLPAGATEKAVVVRISGHGISQSATVAADQTSYTFNITRPTEPPRRLKPIYAGLALAGLIAVVVGLAIAAPRLTDRDPPVRDKVDILMERIASTCAGGQLAINESKILAQLDDYVSGVSAGARVTSAEVGAVTARMTPDGPGYKAYTDCLTSQTENFLKIQGKLVASGPAAGDSIESPSAPAGSGAVPPTAGSTQVAASGQIQGWAYYEHLNGGPTQHGKLMPLLGPAPDFSQVAAGLVLKSRNAFNLRREHNGDAEIVEAVAANQCVRVLADADPQRKVVVGAAHSGGWLQVVRIACPARAA